MLGDMLSTKERLPDFAAVSHLGHNRARNEDFYFIAAEKGLSVVADGVGGQGDGAWASRRAVELLVHRLSALSDPGQADQTIREVLQSVHEDMLAETRHRQGAPGGTTIAGLWAPREAQGSVTVFNIGDSPVFHFSDGWMEKVSRDHSLHQLWLDGGRMGREPGKRTIMQALGISAQISPYIASFATAPGDSVLLCTDGLSSLVPVERMRDVLAQARSSQQACEMLMQIALSGAATDNVTVSVCSF